MRVIHLPRRSGLITARLAGARDATSDVLIFIDSHCEAAVNYLPPLLGTWRGALLLFSPSNPWVPAPELHEGLTWTLGIGGGGWATTAAVLGGGSGCGRDVLGGWETIVSADVVRGTSSGGHAAGFDFKVPSGK